MYKYVPVTHIAHYKAYCQDVLDRLQTKLREEYSIRTHSLLIGSGATNMVTKNGKAGFALDYTLILSGMPRKYDRSPAELKALIQDISDGLINENFSFGQESVSSITYLIHSIHGKRVEFCFDIALIRQPRGSKNKCVLTYDKEQDMLAWKQIPASRKQDSKVESIKSLERWEDVREEYLERKNRYLEAKDNSRPAYVIYNEAVNQVFQAIEGLL